MKSSPCSETIRPRMLMPQVAIEARMIDSAGSAACCTSMSTKAGESSGNVPAS